MLRRKSAPGSVMGFFNNLRSWVWPSTPGLNPSAPIPDGFDSPQGNVPSDPAVAYGPRDPYNPDPYSDGQWNALLAPVPTNPLLDQVRADSYPPPYTKPNELDDYGRETETMRRAYRDLHRKEPSIRAAIKGKVAAVASLDVSVVPEDPDDDMDCKVAEFVNWTVKKSPHGWDGLAAKVLEPAFLDGFSLNEIVQKAHTDSRKWYGAHGLKYVKNRDTANFSLRLDAYRNVLGVVNGVRGLRTHDPRKLILFTHSDLFDNPFGQSDLRAAYRSANLIDAAYELWYTAVKIYGAPFLTGRVADPVRKAAFEKMLKNARAHGYAVCPVEDEIDVLNMASATSFDAFEAKVNKHREEIFMAVRGAYLPFLEGQGNDANGDTAVHKVASDAVEYLIAKALGRVLTHQLVPALVIPNFGDRVGIPTVLFGGVNWAETKQQLEVAETVMGKVAISKRWYYEISQVPPPDGPEDSLGGPPPALPPSSPGAPGQTPPPGAPGQAGPPGQALPPGQAGGQPAAEQMNDEPAGPRAAFGADLAKRYADYFAPDRHGRYAGNMHDEFGMTPAQFADASGLVRKATGKGEKQTWVWAPKSVVVPVAKIGTDPDRLQFRPFDGADGLSATRRSELTGTFDPAKAPPVALWKDPKTGQDIVVDGHKRLADAKAAGVPAIRAIYIQASTADQARAIGAEMNSDPAPAKPAAQTFAASDDTGGHWVTIGAHAHESSKGSCGGSSTEHDSGPHGGTPVFIKDGKIVKGPSHMIGKAPHELGNAPQPAAAPSPPPPPPPSHGHKVGDRVRVSNLGRNHGREGDVLHVTGDDRLDVHFGSGDRELVHVSDAAPLVRQPAASPPPPPPAAGRPPRAGDHVRITGSGPWAGQAGEAVGHATDGSGNLLVRVGEGRDRTHQWFEPSEVGHAGGGVAHDANGFGGVWRTQRGEHVAITVTPAGLHQGRILRSGTTFNLGTGMDAHRYLDQQNATRWGEKPDDVLRRHQAAPPPPAPEATPERQEPRREPRPKQANPPPPIQPGTPAKSKARLDFDGRAGADKAEMEAKVRDAWQKAGIKLPVEHAADLVGAPDDAKVSIGHYNGSLRVSIIHPKFEAFRTIQKDADGFLHMKNDLFEVKQEHRGEGLGEQVFASQVEGAQAAGCKYIKTWAAGGPRSARHGGFNGFYTWPRFGYDMQLRHTGLGSDALAQIEEIAPGAKTVLDLFATAEGRNWWKNVGGVDLTDAKFDLRPGSRSIRVLNAYREERAAKKGAA
jgi:hypothetical protein